MQGKLPTQKYPTFKPFNFNERPDNLIVFMVGGATYQESREIAITYNSSANKVVFGGTYMHNSQSFIAEVSQIGALRGGQGNIGSLEIQ